MKNSDIFSKAFNMTFKHKALWLLALVASIQLGTANSFMQYVDPMSILNRPLMAYYMTTYGVMLVLTLISMLINARGLASLIAGIDRVHRGDTISFSQGWQLGKPFSRRLLGWTLLVWIVNIVITVVLMLPYLIGMYKMQSGSQYLLGDSYIPGGAYDPTAGLGWMLAGIPGCCLVVLFGITVGALIIVTNVHIVLEDRSIKDGFLAAWKFLRANFKRVIGFYLLMVVLSLIPSIAVGIGAYIFIFMKSMLILMDVPTVVNILLSIVLGGIGWLITSAGMALIAIFQYSAMIELYHDLKTPEPVADALPEIV